ncbi:MAG: hypothetical protein EOP43_05570, partial [Sphingobacteriaceae bacterium]
MIYVDAKAQQVKKIDCCKDVNPKATIIINDNTSGNNTAATVSTNPANGIFNFELKSDLNTSAGVYNSEGVLIRTLWNGVRYEAGCYEAQWDGLLDDGVTVAALGNYTIKVLTNALIVTHKGGYGSTSNGAINGFGQITGFCFADGKAYYGDSFAEGGTQTHYLNLTNINKSYNYLEGFSSTILNTVTDGEKVYSLAQDQYAAPFNNFIIAAKVSDNINYKFPAGTTIIAGRGGSLPISVIGLRSEGNF